MTDNTKPMLQPATNRQAFAKVGIYGSAGSGKTYTAAKMAIGLHQYAKLTKPVGFFDTEPAAGYVLPLFEEAGIELLVYDQSRALADLMQFMDEAEQTCSIVIIDSITHVWREAQSAYLKKINDGRARQRKAPIIRLEFQHWMPIKAAWAQFSDRFLSSKLHVIVCGRAGTIYEYQERDDGSNKKELISTGTRMATEKELGHEPSLLIEMIAEHRDGKTVNAAVIQKDRADKINGKEFDMPSFDDFKPHFARLNLGGEHFESMDKRDSTELYTEEGDDNWSAEQRNRAIWSEEIQGLLVKAHPGQTAIEKQAKSDLLHAIFNTRSWTKVENTPSASLKAGYIALKDMLEAVGKLPSDPPKDEDITAEIPETNARAFSGDPGGKANTTPPGGSPTPADLASQA